MAVIVQAQTGNDSDAATWVGGVAPGAGDSVMQAGSLTLTLTANRSWLGSGSALAGNLVNAGFNLSLGPGSIFSGTSTGTGEVHLDGIGPGTPSTLDPSVQLGDGATPPDNAPSLSNDGLDFALGDYATVNGQLPANTPFVVQFTTIFSAANPGTIAILGDNSGPGGLILDGGGPYGDFFRIYSYWPGYQESHSSIPVEGTHVHTFTFDGNNLTWNIDGVDQVTWTQPFPSNTNALQLGNTLAGTVSSIVVNGTPLLIAGTDASPSQNTGTVSNLQCTNGAQNAGNAANSQFGPDTTGASYQTSTGVTTGDMSVETSAVQYGECDGVVQCAGNPTNLDSSMVGAGGGKVAVEVLSGDLLYCGAAIRNAPRKPPLVLNGGGF